MTTTLDHSGDDAGQADSDALPRVHKPVTALLADPWSIAAGFTVLLAVALRSWGGPRLYDDAYITFRYAENFARGHDLVFNSGERIMGASCPLWMLLLSLLSLVHIDLPSAAVWIGIACDAVSVFLLTVIGRRLGHPSIGIGAALLYAVVPQSVVTGLSGMETPLFIALILATAALYGEGNEQGAATCVGLVALLRPEGVLWAIPLLLFITLERKRIPWKLLFAAGAPLCAWLLFATWHYGSPIPQSVVAKSFLPRHPGLFDNALMILQATTTPIFFFDGSKYDPALGYGLLRTAILGLMAIGLLFAPLWEGKAFRVLLLGSLLYAAAYSVVDKYMFVWYFSVLLPCAALIQAAGLYAIFRHRPSRLTASGVCLAFVFYAAFIFHCARAEIRKSDHTLIPQERAYLDAGHWIHDHYPPSSRIAIAEIGAFGWADRSGRIEDLCGLVTRGMDRYVFLRKDGLPPTAYLDQSHPDLYVSFATVDFMPNFHTRYHLVKTWPSWPGRGDLRVYALKPPQEKLK